MIKITNRYAPQPAKEAISLRLYKTLVALFFLMAVNAAYAQSYTHVTPTQPGYYYVGNQTQAYQTQGNQTDYRGIMNGGVTAGPVGVQGFNQGYTYSYPQQQTQYRQVQMFYQSNGTVCYPQTYNNYQIPSGSPVYFQNGQPYRQSAVSMQAPIQYQNRPMNRRR